MLNKNYAIMKKEDGKVTLNVTTYQAGKIYQLLLEKGKNFKNANLPGIANHYFRLAEFISKELDKCVYKD